MRLSFSGKELAAILKLGVAMANADGIFKDSEKEVLAREIMRFGVPNERVPLLLIAAEEMDVAQAYALMSSLSRREKKYVAAYLGVIMAIDGDIDDTELKLWQLTCTLCGFPTMTVREAFDIMDNI